MSEGEGRNKEAANGDLTRQRQFAGVEFIFGLPEVLQERKKEESPDLGKQQQDPQSWFLVPFSIERRKDSLGKWLIIGLWQKIHKMSLKYLAMSENKKVLGKKTQMKSLIKRAQEATERVPNGQSWNNQSN